MNVFIDLIFIIYCVKIKISLYLGKLLFISTNGLLGSNSFDRNEIATYLLLKKTVLLKITYSPYIIFISIQITLVYIPYSP